VTHFKKQGLLERKKKLLFKNEKGLGNKIFKLMTVNILNGCFPLFPFAI
jgi:hypothetical protein